MTRFRNLGAAASFLALTAVASAAVVQGYTFKRVPKQDEVFKYRLKADLEMPGVTASLEGTTTEKTIKVDADGSYTIEATQSDIKLSLGGQEIPAPQSPPQILVYKGDGGIQEIRGEGIEGNAYRIAYLNAFITPDKPVAVGETWTKEIPADTQKGTLAIKFEYKVLGEEKVGDLDTIKISSNVTETGAEAASSSATTWVNKNDFTLVKSEGKWNKAPFPGAPAPIDASFIMTRVP